MKRMMFILLLMAPGALAQTFTFRYVAPTTAINNAFGNGSGSTASMPANYSWIDVTPANAARFVSAAPPLMRQTYQQLQPGTALRTRVDSVLQISGGVVDPTVYLVDDRTGFVVNWMALSPPENGRHFVWPSATNWDGTGGRRNGAINLGETLAARRGWQNFQEAVVHESLHTQFAGIGGTYSKWGMLRITYGGDEIHRTSELLGEQELTFEEGLGSFFAGVHVDPVAMTRTRDFFASDEARYELESRSVLAGTAAVWNAPHTEESRPLSALREPSERTGSYVIRRYRWHDVPGFYILFSESTTTAFNLWFWRKVNNDRDAAYRMIHQAAGAMWHSDNRRKRYLTYEINRLALQMEALVATQRGSAARTAGTLTSSMFPFALLDILTHFGMTDAEYQRDYRANYPDREPRASTEYWNRRAAVRTLVQPHLNARPIRIEEAIDAAHRYFQQPDTILAAATP